MMLGTQEFPLRRKRAAWSIDDAAGTASSSSSTSSFGSSWGYMDLYACFVPPRQFLRKRRRMKEKQLAPPSPPNINRKYMKERGIFSCDSKENAFDPNLSFEANVQERMRALFECMKRTEKSRSSLLLVPREKLSKEMRRHSDKLLHENTTRKKLVHRFREDLGAALLDKMESTKGDDSPQPSDKAWTNSPDYSSPPRHSISSPHHSPSCSSYSPPRRQVSPYSTPRRVARYAARRRASADISPGNGCFDSPRRVIPSPRNSPGNSPSRAIMPSPSRFTAHGSPNRAYPRSPPHFSLPRYSSKYHSPERRVYSPPSRYHSSTGQGTRRSPPSWDSKSPPREASITTRTPDSENHQSPSSSHKTPNRVSPCKSPERSSQRVAFAGNNIPKCSDSPDSATSSPTTTIQGLRPALESPERPLFQPTLESCAPAKQEEAPTDERATAVPQSPPQGPTTKESTISKTIHDSPEQASKHHDETQEGEECTTSAIPVQ